MGRANPSFDKVPRSLSRCSRAHTRPTTALASRKPVSIYTREVTPVEGSTGTKKLQRPSPIRTIVDALGLQVLANSLGVVSALLSQARRARARAGRVEIAHVARATHKTLLVTLDSVTGNG